MRNKKPFATSSPSSEEEFFQIPRGEFLMKNLERFPQGKLGDLAVNLPCSDGQRFTLRMGEECMKGADILPGDYLVVQPQDTFREGEILAVLLGDRVVIRRFFLSGNRIRLECDPPTGRVIIAEKDTPGFQILGRVVQILREL